MDRRIFHFMWQFSKRQQIFLLGLGLLSMPLTWLLLEVPKSIVNDAIEGGAGTRNFLGLDLEQVPFLAALCLTYLGLLLINGGLKYVLNIYRGVVSEKLLRRLRYMLLERVMRFPLPHFRSVSEGEIVSMVTNETDALTEFISNAFSLPALQGGTLITLLAFMFAQNPLIGLIAVALFPLQAWLIPKLQREVNALSKERITHVRKLSERIGETVSGAPDIHTHGTADYELSEFSSRFQTIYEIRYKIYVKKFFIKFLNNFLGSLTPLFFYGFGGYLVITGDLSFGALVAVLTAYKDILPLWKDLLNFYQKMEDARVRYQYLADQFEPEQMMAAELLSAPATQPAPAPIRAISLSYQEAEGDKLLQAASFDIQPTDTISLSSTNIAGTTALARLLSRQLAPTTGTLSLGDRPFTELSERDVGAYIGYVDQDVFIRSGTIADNLYYGLLREPMPRPDLPPEAQAARATRLDNAVEAGNSRYDIGDDWIDYRAAGVADAGALMAPTAAVLRRVGLDGDVFGFAMRQRIDPDRHPGTVRGLMAARVMAGQRLHHPDYAGLIEVFEADRFLENGTVAENILFGTPIGPTFDTEHIEDNGYVVGLLRQEGLYDRFLSIGQQIATLMVELFRTLPPGHEFFERFSFIRADDLPDYQRITLQVASRGIDSLDDTARLKLLSLPFKGIPARHRLGLLTAEVKDRILAMRRAFRAQLPDDQKAAIEFFDAARYNANLSIQDNILFGKLATEKGQDAGRIDQLVRDVISELGLYDPVLEIGLGYDVGVGGKRLTAVQRQKLSVARTLLKSPRFLIYNRAGSALDDRGEQHLRAGALEQLAGSAVLWIGNQPLSDPAFTRHMTMDDSRLAEAAGAAVPVAPHAPGPDEEDDGMLGKETSLLQSLPLFSGVDRSRLKLLAFTSEQRSFEAGADLFEQGLRGDVAYVVLEGACDVLVAVPDGDKVIAQVGKGAILGELALICDQPRSATVRATSSVKVLTIAKDVFLALLRESPELSVTMTRLLADRLEQTLHQLTEIND